MLSHMRGNEMTEARISPYTEQDLAMVQSTYAYYPPRYQVETFLDMLFRGCPEEHYISFWTAPKKHSIFVPVGQWKHLIDQLIRQSSEGQDVYVCIGLSKRDYGLTRRCPANEVSGLVGLWADIDVKHPVHKKQNLPPTMADAFTLLNEVGPSPAVVVWSGHGLQAWWLFQEPWIFENELDRSKAAALAKRWISSIRLKAAAHGWDVDSVGDLARLMRLPGLLNWKEARQP
jgi:hypothetical protein